MADSKRKPKPKRLKIYQTVRKHFTSIQFSEGRRWFHSQLLFEQLKCILAIVLQCIYFFYKANAPEEFMNSIFMTTVCILVFISFVSTARKMEMIFSFMDQDEIVINKRKLLNQMFRCEAIHTKFIKIFTNPF